MASNFIKKREHLVFALVFVIAAGAIRFFRLEDQSLWNDEMFSLDVASSGLLAIQQKLVMYYHHPPLFFYLVHFAIKLLGESAWALRCVPALFGGLTAGTAFLAANRIFGRLPAFFSAAILSVSPFHLSYSQEGRPYALAGFLCLLGAYLLFLIVDEKKFRWKILYLAASVALLYTHHWGIFAVASHVVYVMFFSGIPREEKKGFMIIWSVAGLLYLPELSALRIQAASPGPSGYFWAERPDAAEIYRILTAFSGTYFKMASSVFNMPTVLELLGALAAMVLLMGGFISAGRGGMRFVTVCFTCLLSIPLVISIFRPEVFLWYRYTVIAFPLFCVLAGGAAGRRGFLYSTAASVLIGAGIAGTLYYFSWSKSNVKDVAAYVTKAAQGGVNIIIRPRSFAPLLNYYYHGTAVQYDEAYLDQPLGEVIDTAASFTYISLEVQDDIRGYMDGHFEKISERRFPGEAHMGMVVGVYKQRPDTSEETGGK